MRALYLIPARGGSKGVPGKNIRQLGGVPLIVHTIRSALQAAPSAEDVVVSTDSEEIAAIAREAGATVPFLRPAELATDTSGSREVMLHALREIPRDTIVLLQPTSPFRNPDDIRRALELYEKETPDMVVTVKAAATNPYYNAYETVSDGSLRISKGDGKVTRRQDAPEVWEMDGAVYVINADSLARYPSLAMMERILPVISTAKHNIDIDTELDFRLAELIAESRIS